MDESRGAPERELEPEIHPLTLRFAEDDLERGFLEEFAAKSIRQIRTSVVLSAAGAFPTYVLVAPAVAEIPGMRRAVAIFLLGIHLTIVLALFGLTLLPRFARWMQPGLAAISFLWAAAAIELFRRAPGDRAATVGLLLLCLVTVAYHTGVRLRFVHATAVCAALAALYVASLFGRPSPLSRTDLAIHVFAIGLTNAWAMGIGHRMEALVRRDFAASRLLERAREKSERLLLNILPRSIAERLKDSRTSIADAFDDVSVLFADLVGFTPLAERMAPDGLVRVLNEVFSEFDELADRHGLEKIKTIGDAYMVAGGLPERRDGHAEAIAEMALGMTASTREFTARTGLPLELRIGIHTGSVVAGVIGKRKFIYDLWGDTVNTASRMESHGLGGTIQVTQEAYERLRSRYELEPRGAIEVKGKGEMMTWFLRGRRDDAAATSA